MRQKTEPRLSRDETFNISRRLTATKVADDSVSTKSTHFTSTDAAHKTEPRLTNKPGWLHSDYVWPGSGSGLSYPQCCAIESDGWRRAIKTLSTRGGRLQAMSVVRIPSCRQNAALSQRFEFTIIMFFQVKKHTTTDSWSFVVANDPCEQLNK